MQKKRREKLKKKERESWKKKWKKCKKKRKKKGMHSAFLFFKKKWTKIILEKIIKKLYGKTLQQFIVFVFKITNLNF